MDGPHVRDVRGLLGILGALIGGVLLVYGLKAFDWLSAFALYAAEGDTGEQALFLVVGRRPLLKFVGVHLL